METHRDRRLSRPIRKRARAPGRARFVSLSCGCRRSAGCRCDFDWRRNRTRLTAISPRLACRGVDLAASWSEPERFGATTSTARVTCASERYRDACAARGTFSGGHRLCGLQQGSRSGFQLQVLLLDRGLPAFATALLAHTIDGNLRRWLGGNGLTTDGSSSFLNSTQIVPRRARTSAMHSARKLRHLTVI